MKPLKSGRAKTYSRPLASKFGGAFALPALQLVPPLVRAYGNFLILHPEISNIVLTIILD